MLYEVITPGNTGTIANGKQILYTGLQFRRQFNAVGIKFYLNPIQKRMTRVHPGCQFFERLEHFYNTLKVPVGKHETQIAGGGLGQRSYNFV